MIPESKEQLPNKSKKSTGEADILQKQVIFTIR